MIQIALVALFIVMLSYGNVTNSTNDDNDGHGYEYDGCQSGDLTDLLERSWCPEEEEDPDDEYTGNGNETN
jgi:hypothetical protein